jgi:hypothetical protein
VKKEKMKTKMKGKAKCEAIIGIAMAVIMLASVFATMVLMGSAVSKGDEYNYIGNTTASVQKVLIGQNLQFTKTAPNNNFTAPPMVYRVVEGYVENIYTTDANYRIHNVNWPTLGAYHVNYVDATTYDAQLAVEDTHLPLKLKVGTKEVTSIAVGTYLRIDTGGINLFDNDKVDLEIIGPEGKITFKNGQVFTNITVAALQEFGSTNTNRQINTTGWNVGDYTFQIKTRPDYACGLDVSSAIKHLAITTGEIDISAEKTFCVELETIKLTVTGVSGDTININATPSSSHVLFVGGVEDTPPAADGKDNFDDMIDVDGIRTYAVKFDDTGSYTIKVTVKGGPRDGDYDTVDIAVSEKAVIFDLPSTVVIGERFTINGMANTGERVTIAVDDYVYTELDRLVIDENGEFEKEIDTAAATDVGEAFSVPGSVRLKAYIDRPKASSYPEKIGTGEIDDGSTKVFMVGPWLTAGLSTDSVDLGDEFTISGTAKGSKQVDILIISPKGAGGTKIDGTSKGMYMASTSVSRVDGTFSKRIRVGEDIDMGSYLVAVLSPGADGRYGKVGWPDLDEALSCYSLAARTQDEILEILDDIVSLSDDLVCVGYIKVGWIETLILNPIPDVVVGNPLEVTGKTSRKEGSIIWIMIKGRYYEIVPQAAIVKDNTFNATFDTTDAQPGIYIVKAIDGYGYTAATTVNILAETPPTPTSFDTGEGTYPSIMGTHNGTITIQRRYT